MKFTDYEDERGRKYRTKLPDEAPMEEAPMGMPVGPPDVVDYIGLPEPLATRLHNLLHERELFTIDDVRKRPRVLFGVLQSALKVDVNILMEGYREAGREYHPIGEDGRGN